MDISIQVRENRLIIQNNHSMVSVELMFEKDEEKFEFLQSFLSKEFNP